MSNTPNTFPDTSCLSCAGMQKTEIAKENFNVYAIYSTAIVFITNEFFCIALPAATPGLLNINSSLVTSPSEKRRTHLNMLAPLLVLLLLLLLVTRPLPRDGGMAEDHGVPEAEQLPRVWTRGRKETESRQ